MQRELLSDKTTDVILMSKIGIDPDSSNNENKQGNFLETLSQITVFLGEDILLSAHVLLWLAFIGIASERRAVEVIKERIKEEKKFIDTYIKSNFKERLLKSQSDRIGWLIEFAKKSDVPFNMFISILTDIFPFEILKEIVPVKVLLRFYGSEAENWNFLDKPEP